METTENTMETIVEESVEKTVYTVTLMDGTELTGLTENGSYYVGEYEIDPALFEDNCSTVVVSDGTNEETLTNMKLINVIKMTDTSWGFALRKYSDKELKDMQTAADLEYLAMMTGVEL